MNTPYNFPEGSLGSAATEMTRLNRLDWEVRPDRTARRNEVGVVQPFLVSVEEREPGRFAAILSGEIDLSVIAHLEAHLLPMITLDALVAADLSRVSFMDSSGLHLLNRITKLAKGTGARFLLCAPSPEVQRVFDLVGAELFLEIRTDLRSALAGN